MKIGLVGFPGPGKTTVFNALTGLSAETGYGAARGKTNLGVVKVPDARVEALAELFSPRRRPSPRSPSATSRPSRRRRLGSRPRSQGARGDARDGLALPGGARLRRSGRRGARRPLREVDDLEAEMILADLELVEKRLERLKKEKGNPREADLLAQLKAQLERGKPLRELRALGRRLGAVLRLPLPDPEAAADGPQRGRGPAWPSRRPPAIADHAAARGLGLVVLSAKVEQDIAQMPPDGAEGVRRRARPRRAGARPLHARGLRPARPHQLPHRRRGRMPRLADPQRLTAQQGGREGPLATSSAASSAPR